MPKHNVSTVAIKSWYQAILMAVEYIKIVFFVFAVNMTTSMVYWSEFLATVAEVPGSIPGATRFSE
jgi:hypothetical protein